MVALRVASAVLFGLVGVVALMMARRGLTAKSLLPFHQAAAGRPWTELSPGEKSVATALTRALGLGFLTAGLALLVACVTAVAHQDVATYALAAIARRLAASRPVPLFAPVTMYLRPPWFGTV